MTIVNNWDKKGEHMIFKKVIFIVLAILFSPSVYAIPPPDALVSIWQSTLQLLGVVSVFLVGFYYSLRQYLSAWKKPIIGFILITLIGVGAYSFLKKQTPEVIAAPITETKQPTDVPFNNSNSLPIKNSLIQGDTLSIEEVISREADEHTRLWKLATYKEMHSEMTAIRKHEKLPAITMQTITSFTPKSLSQHLTKSPEKLFLLDVRAAYERKQFSIAHQATAHYGDLIHSSLPETLSQQLPKDKLIVVLCHSGLRGYIAANLLRQLGYENVAFLQGGLAAWSQQKLPINGREDYTSNFSTYPVFSEQKVYEDKEVLKVEIDADDNIIQGIPNLIHLPFEIARSKDIDKIVQQSKTKPVLIICKSYGGCFHIQNLGYLIEQAGGKVAGVFDKTGQFVIPPLTE